MPGLIGNSFVWRSLLIISFLLSLLNGPAEGWLMEKGPVKTGMTDLGVQVVIKFTLFSKKKTFLFWYNFRWTEKSKMCRVPIHS